MSNINKKLIDINFCAEKKDGSEWNREDLDILTYHIIEWMEERDALCGGGVRYYKELKATPLSQDILDQLPPEEDEE